MSVSRNLTVLDNQHYSLPEKLEYIKYSMKYLSRKVAWKFLKKNLKINFVRDILPVTKANDWIYDSLKSNKPFVAGKFGCIEISAISEVLKSEMHLGKMNQKDKQNLLINAGFFPIDDQSIKEFVDLYLDLMPNIDILGTWNTRFEDYIVKKYMPDTQLSSLEFLEPYYFEKPWSQALEGKKVLVIHPFTKTIHSQYDKRELLFKNKNILPEFNLITLKAVQTIAGNKSEFDNWFQALDFMYDRAMEIDFDVALVGCGAYGLPLAIKFKQAGKQAIHTGGTTQVMFGIKGARWDQNPRFVRMYNQHWVRPNETETPKNSVSVEGACYW